MAAGQQFLFAPEKPLVQRLGGLFFREIPRRPGVYKMRDARDAIIYVGKAKDLRQRLGSYRVANPERLRRRSLRLLRQVTRIDFDLCRDEAAALKHEARLIRELKPRFNRAGVWQAKPRFLAWRTAASGIEFSVQEVPLCGQSRVGPLGAFAPRLLGVLARLLWLVMNSAAGYHQLPFGWRQGATLEAATIDSRGRTGEIRAALMNAFWDDHAMFLNWLAVNLNRDWTAFERAAIAKDVETLKEFIERQQRLGKDSGQMALL